jgi:hypothetical protein
MPETNSWFDVLGLSSSATIDDVKRARRQHGYGSQQDRMPNRSHVVKLRLYV